MANLPHGQLAQVAWALKLVYFPIPKAGNSYVRRWLNASERFETFGSYVEIPPEETYDSRWQYCSTLVQLPGGQKSHIGRPEFTFFTVVRHPALRALSAFRDKRRLNDADPVRGSLPRRAWRSFPHFVEALAARDRLYRDGHWAPITWQLGESLQDLDYIFKLECLDEQGPEIMRTLGLKGTPRRDSIQHRTSLGETNRKELQASMPAILELYARDFEAFQYDESFEL